MPVSTVEVLIDLLEEQEGAIEAIEVQLSVGQDLSPAQLEAVLQLKQRFEDNCDYLEAMIQAWSTSDSFAQAGGHVHRPAGVRTAFVDPSGPTHRNRR